MSARFILRMTALLLPLTLGACSGKKATGIDACDSYLAKYEHCVGSKVPKGSRKAYEDNLASTRAAWTAMANNPGARPGLGQACETALERARTTMEPYHCAW